MAGLRYIGHWSLRFGIWDLDMDAELSPEQERELARRAAGGDGLAFEALTERYYRPVGGFLLRRVGLADVVEDLAQDTIKSLLSRAYRALRVRLGGKDEEEP